MYEKNKHLSYVLAASTSGGAEAVLRRRFNTIRLLMEAACVEAVLVCVLPIACYVRKSCCSDTSHLINRGESDFEEILVSGTETCRTVVWVEGANAGLSIFTFNPIAAFSNMG